MDDSKQQLETENKGAGDVAVGTDTVEQKSEAPNDTPLPVADVQPKPKHGFDKGLIIETIVLVCVTTVAAIFIGLFVQTMLAIDEVNSNQDGKIELARSEGRAEQQALDNINHARLEKNPWLEFIGPASYGTLRFKYPRTWSLYVRNDASRGGNFEAFFNPGGINPNPESDLTKSALRVTIFSRRFDEVIQQYSAAMANGSLNMEVIRVNNDNANQYVGFFSNNVRGKAVVFGVRDKTVVLRTDAMLFEEDFDELVKTITFNR
jgi:hypothetical protein